VRLRSPTGAGTESVCLSSVPEPDVLRRVVIRVHFVPALLALKVFSLAVVRVRKPTVCREQRWDVWFGSTCSTETPCSGALYETYSNRRPERDVVPFSLRKPLSNVSFRSSNAITSQSCSMASFDEFVCDRVDVLFPPCFFTLPEAKQSLVCGLRPTVLHLTTLLELTTPVVVVVIPARTSRLRTQRGY